MDSTNTRRHLRWIHAEKATLKFTFNQWIIGPFIRNKGVVCDIIAQEGEWEHLTHQLFLELCFQQTQLSVGHILGVCTEPVVPDDKPTERRQGGHVWRGRKRNGMRGRDGMRRGGMG